MRYLAICPTVSAAKSILVYIYAWKALVGASDVDGDTISVELWCQS
jgi:hypothetical protein